MPADADTANHSKARSRALAHQASPMDRVSMESMALVALVEVAEPMMLAV